MRQRVELQDTEPKGKNAQSSASKLVQAAVFASLVSVFSANAEGAVHVAHGQKSIDPSLMLNAKPKLHGDYGEVLNKSFLSLQTEERNARKNGAGMSGRFVRFEELRTPKNPLKLFYNNGDLLKSTLGKTLQEITEVNRLNDENVESAVSKIFKSGDDRTWLRQTKNNAGVPYSEADYSRYREEVERARLALYLRLQDSRFRTFAIERFNTFLPKLEARGNIGPKTLQAVLSGIMALADILENAEHVSRTGRSISTNPMLPFDQASQIARLVTLTSGDTQILRVHISLPDRGETLVYFVGQHRPMVSVFWDTKKDFGVTWDVAVDILIRAMKQAIDETGSSMKGR